MSSIQMKEASVDKVLHAFKTLLDYGIDCSMELHHGDASDPFMSFTNELVSAEYFECAGGGDSIEVTAGNTVLNFELGKYNCFGLHVGAKQVFLSFSGNGGVAWFNSSEATPEAINEILTFKDEDPALGIQIVCIKNGDSELIGKIESVFQAIKNGAELIDLQSKDGILELVIGEPS